MLPPFQQGHPVPRMQSVHFSESLLEVLNEVIPRAEPLGAFGCGMVALAAFSDKLEPNRELLETVARCSNVDDILRAYELWKADKNRPADWRDAFK